MKSTELDGSLSTTTIVLFQRKSTCFKNRLNVKYGASYLNISHILVDQCNYPSYTTMERYILKYHVICYHIMNIHYHIIWIDLVYTYPLVRYMNIQSVRLNRICVVCNLASHLQFYYNSYITSLFQLLS